jgi:hypothetical protein
MTPRAKPRDIEWIDSYGHARVCGHTVHKSAILALEQPGDRRSDGHLTAVAKERIASTVTEQLCALHNLTPGVLHVLGQPMTWRHCDG